MNPKELKKKSEKDLQQLIDEKRERIRQLRFTVASGKVKNVKEIRTLKRDIARILTTLSNKENQKDEKVSLEIDKKEKIKNK